MEAKLTSSWGGGHGASWIDTLQHPQTPPQASGALPTCQSIEGGGGSHLPTHDPEEACCYGAAAPPRLHSAVF